MSTLDDDWLVEFIQDYKTKLVEEKMELACSARLLATSRNRPQQVAGHHLEGPSKLDNNTTQSASTEVARQPFPTSSVEYHSDSMFPDEIDRSDAADRKRKQQEYHCILDQQIAEKKLLKNQQERMYKTASDDFENGSSQLDSSRTSVRCPSPPIKSHYRNVMPFRVPVRPLTAANSNEKRLSDLTELRQLYTNR